jgi:hypothetical protein
MYQEICLDGAARQFADCAWLLNPDPGEAKDAKPILPDGHADLVLIVGKGVQIFGPTSSVRFVPKDQSFLGIRLRLGAAGTMAGVALDELLDRSFSLQVLWGALGREIEERVLVILAEALGARISTGLAPDRSVLRTVCQLQRFPNVRVRKLARDVGLSERQLLRHPKWSNSRMHAHSWRER